MSGSQEVTYAVNFVLANDQTNCHPRAKAVATPFLASPALWPSPSGSRNSCGRKRCGIMRS
jgi:hypothetical protein